MSICKLISEEIKTIQKDILDINDISSENYEIYLEQINDKIKRLEKIKNLLKAERLDEFDKLLENGIIDIKNLTIKNFATSAKEIKVDTVVFLGDLLAYQHPIPKSMKIMFGALQLIDVEIFSIELNFASVVECSNCKNLSSVSVRHGSTLALKGCSELSQIRVLELKFLLKIVDCPALKIDKIESFEPNKKIQIASPHRFSVLPPSFTQEEIDSKFTFIEKSSVPWPFGHS